MSITTPAIQQLTFEIETGNYGNGIPKIMTIRAVKGTVGVTLGQFIQVLRNDVESIQRLLELEGPA